MNEGLESPCLEVFKTLLKKALSKLACVEVGSDIIAVPALGKGLLILQTLPSELCMTAERRKKGEKIKKKAYKKLERLLCVYIQEILTSFMPFFLANIQILGFKMHCKGK